MLSPGVEILFQPLVEWHDSQVCLKNHDEHPHGSQRNGQRKPGVTGLSVRARRVAFLACYLDMHPRQRIPRLRVVEFLDGATAFQSEELWHCWQVAPRRP